MQHLLFLCVPFVLVSPERHDVSRRSALDIEVDVVTRRVDFWAVRHAEHELEPDTLLA
jgi:hypothetical protein